jgi:hypothetical protein
MVGFFGIGFFVVLQLFTYPTLESRGQKENPAGRGYGDYDLNSTLALAGADDDLFTRTLELSIVQWAGREVSADNLDSGPARIAMDLFRLQPLTSAYITSPVPVGPE